MNILAKTQDVGLLYWHAVPWVATQPVAIHNSFWLMWAQCTSRTGNCIMKQPVKVSWDQRPRSQRESGLCQIWVVCWERVNSQAVSHLQTGSLSVHRQHPRMFPKKELRCVGLAFQQVRTEAFRPSTSTITTHWILSHCVVITLSNQKDATNHSEVACFIYRSSRLHFGLWADPAEMGAGRQSSEQELPATIQWFKWGIILLVSVCSSFLSCSPN